MNWKRNKNWNQSQNLLSNNSNFVSDGSGDGGVFEIGETTRVTVL
jgi:hypothetical protein